MPKSYPFISWASLILIILLVLFSVYGAFLGSADAWEFFNSRLIAVYWFALLFVLLTGLVNVRKLLKTPGLLLIHLGCTLVLVGAIYGSEVGHQIQRKLFGIDKIRKGQMLLYQDQESNQVKVEGSGRVRELPFSIKLKEFRIEYYEPECLRVQTPQGGVWDVPIELNTLYDLGSKVGKLRILRQFRNFKIVNEGTAGKIIDSNEAGCNPAVEVQIEYPDGSIINRYVFKRFKNHANTQKDFILAYGSTIRDYISDIQVIKDGKVVGEKRIEVNHPFHFGGYHFYQSSFDNQELSYTVLSVISDTGLSLVYTGYLALGIGVFWHFWLRHIFTKRVNGN
jgi:hypothetical protein